MELLLFDHLSIKVTITLLLALLYLLQLKHLIVDWLWQPSYEWQNKGTYGHFGGIRHALKNGIGTALCFSFFVSPITILYILLIDTIIHYHVDWAKMNLNRINKWDANTPQFFGLIGFDQFIHQITYLALIGIFL